jgi:uncharacterized protein (DUF486 family)
MMATMTHSAPMMIRLMILIFRSDIFMTFADDGTG